MAEKERLIWADSLKGWLMMLVILGHSIQNVIGDNCYDNHLWNIIYSFHMPAFFAVSGWFMYRSYISSGGGISLIVRRIWQLLVPYLIWSLVVWFRGSQTIDSLLNIVLKPGQYFWFLWILFLISCISIFVQMLAKRLKIDEIIPFGIVCVLLIGLMVFNGTKLFGFQYLSYYFLFYIIGYCIHRFSWLQLKNLYVIVALFIFWAFMAWFWKMHELPVWMGGNSLLPSSILQYLYRGTTAFVAILVLLSIFPLYLNKEWKVNKQVALFGGLSLGVYVAHLTFPVATVTKSILIYIDPIKDWQHIVWYAVICGVLAYLLVLLLSKNKITAKYLLGKI